MGWTREEGSLVTLWYRGLPCLVPFGPSWILRVELSQINVFKGRFGEKRERECIFSDPQMVGEYPDHKGWKVEEKEKESGVSEACGNASRTRSVRSPFPWW